jgi:hypothetical protein
MRSSVRHGAMGLLILTLAGCGQRPTEPDLLPVSGRVTLKDGSPLPGAVVTFLPEGATKGIAYSGRTDQDGNYSLKSARGNEGAAEGEYKVTVSKLVLPDGSDFDPVTAGVGEIDSGAQQKLPAYYSDPDKTILKRKVTKGGGPVDLPLKVGKTWK